MNPARLLSALLFLALAPAAASALVQEEDYFTAPQPDALDNIGYAVAIDGKTMVITAPYEASNASGVNGNQADDSLPGAGAAWVYGLSGGNWVLQAYLKAPNPGANDNFGISAAISGDTIVIGAYREDSAATGVNGVQGSEAAPDSGAAYVYVRSGGTWAYQAYLKASNTGTGDGFGYAVAISGNTIVVGSPYEDSAAAGIGGVQANDAAPDSGAVYVFTRSGTVWTQQAYVKASNTGAGDIFGLSVSISGNTMIVGAPQEDSAARTVNGSQADNAAADAGAGYVFLRTGSAWAQQAYLKASNAGADDRFGHSVSVSGNMIAAGAIHEDSAARGINGIQTDNTLTDAGAAYIFRRTGTAWAQEAYVKAPNTDSYDYFGISVAAGVETVLIGAPFERSNAPTVDGTDTDNSLPGAGAAYLYTRTGTTWSKQAYLKSRPDVNDAFGWSVALSGGRALVGSTTLYSAGNYTGVATLFSGAGLGPLAVWRLKWFGSTDSAGQGMDTADPDGDGVINLLEFATGTSPLSPNPAPGILVKNGSNLEFTWFRNSEIWDEDIALWPQWSDDLIAWNDWGIYENESVPGGSGDVTAILPAGDGPRFMRLRLDR